MTTTMPISSVPQDATQTLNARRASLIFVAANAISIVTYMVVAWQTGAWQLWGLVLISLVLASAGGASFLLSSRGKPGLAMIVIISATILGGIFGSALVAGVGALLAIVIVLVSLTLAAQALPRQFTNRVLLLSGLAGVFAVVVNLVSEPLQAEILVLQNIIPVLSALTFIAFGFLVARQFVAYPISTKLLVIILVVVLLAVLAVTLTANQMTRVSLEDQVGSSLSSIARAQSFVTGDFLANQVSGLQTLARDTSLEEALVARNTAYDAGATGIRAQIQEIDQQWQEAYTSKNNTASLVRSVLNNDISTSLKKYHEGFADIVGMLLTDKYGASLGSTDFLPQYSYGSEAWWQEAYNQGAGDVYIGYAHQPEGNEVSFVIAIPLYQPDSREVLGVLSVTFRASTLFANLNSFFIAQDEKTYLLFPDGTLLGADGLVETIEPELLEQMEALTAETHTALVWKDIPSLVSQEKILSSNPSSGETISELGWSLIVQRSSENALRSADTTARTILFVSLAVILVAGFLSSLAAQFLTSPIRNLMIISNRISNGDLNVQATIEADDEIGELASSFNIMTIQLRETLAGLEQRVEARTKDLATVAEVGTASATILESKRLLQEVVDLTKERFNLYHSHIYLLDEGGQNLALASGAGETGRQMVLKGHSIPLDREQSLVARAARERKGVTVNDVSLAPDFLPNPHLPDTRSELAVPMIVGGKVIGVFDVQSDQVGRFTDSDINIQTTLAAQVATSIQNVRSFEQSKAQADLESLVNAIGQKIQRATTVDDTLQTAIREIGLALGAERVSANIQTRRQRGSDEVSAIEPGV